MNSRKNWNFHRRYI